MHDRHLRAVLTAFAEEAGAHLAAETAGGAEVPFEVVSSADRRRRTPLYCYRPLTAAFIDERAGVLARLPSYLPAAHALAQASGVGAYLEARGRRPAPTQPGARAAAALSTFLGRVFEDSSDFALLPERVERASAELETIVTSGRTEIVVLTPVIGLTLESDEVVLGEGLSLTRAETLHDLPPEVGAAAQAADHCILAVLRWEAANADDDGRAGRARARLRRLQTALRLYDDGGLHLGELTWTRTAGGTWAVLVPGAGGGGGHAGGSCTVTAQQEDELRAFCSLVARRLPRSGEIAWALARFEMGCERGSPFEALTDHLLALRALLAPEGTVESLSRRVAALCALPDQRQALAERVAHAASIERSVVAGLTVTEPVIGGIADEMGRHLRAILRDVLCGHLDSDVRTLADGILAETTGGTQTTAA